MEAKNYVVGRQGPETWTFEAEERPGTRALGPLLTYLPLRPKKRLVAGPAQLAIIAKRIGHDMLEVLTEADVLTWQIGP